LYLCVFVFRCVCVSKQMKLCCI